VLFRSRRTSWQRFPTGVSRHPCHAVWAASIAFWQSATPRSGTDPRTFNVAGLTTSNILFFSTNFPFIYAFSRNSGLFITIFFTGINTSQVEKVRNNMMLLLLEEPGTNGGYRKSQGYPRYIYAREA